MIKLTKEQLKRFKQFKMIISKMKNLKGEYITLKKENGNYRMVASKNFWGIKKGRKGPLLPGSTRIDIDKLVWSQENVIIGPNVTIGPCGIIDPNVTIRPNVTIESDPLVLIGAYKYPVTAYTDKAEDVDIIVMGYFDRTRQEWETDFWNNAFEFTNDGSIKSTMHLNAFKLACQWLDMQRSLK